MKRANPIDFNDYFKPFLDGWGGWNYEVLRKTAGTLEWIQERGNTNSLISDKKVL